MHLLATTKYMFYLILNTFAVSNRLNHGFQCHMWPCKMFLGLISTFYLLVCPIVLGKFNNMQRKGLSKLVHSMSNVPFNANNLIMQLYGTTQNCPHLIFRLTLNRLKFFICLHFSAFVPNNAPIVNFH